MLKNSSKPVTREKLLERGVQMFTERGYHGAGLKDILQSVGVPKGSFYNYFSSKEEFSIAAINHYIEPFIKLLDDWLQRSELDAVTALENYFRELIDDLDRREYKGGCLLGNLIGEVGDTSVACRSALSSAYHRYRDKLREAIERGQREGLLRSDKHPAEMADFLADAWQGALLRMKIEQSTKPLEACCAHLLRDYFKP